jgi:hypothetical protein
MSGWPSPPVLFPPCTGEAVADVGAGEVVASWGGAIFRVEHLDLGASRGAARASRTTFTVGEDPGCDVWVPPEATGGRARVPLARAVRGRLAVALPPDAGASLLTVGGTARDLPYLQRFGRAPWSRDVPGLCEVELEPGERLRVDLGPIVFHVRVVAARPRRPARRRLDWVMAVVLLNSLTLHALVLLLALRWEGDPAGLSFDVVSSGWVEPFGDPARVAEPAGDLSGWSRWPPPGCPWDVGGRDLCGRLLDSCRLPPCDDCIPEDVRQEARGSEPDDRRRAEGRGGPRESRTRR